MVCYGIISYVSDLIGWINMVGVFFIFKLFLISIVIKCIVFWVLWIKSFKIVVIGLKIKGVLIIWIRFGRSLFIVGRIF